MKLDGETLTLEEVKQYFPEAMCTRDIVYCIHKGSLFRTNGIECPALNLESLKQTNLPYSRYFLCVETMFEKRTKIKAGLDITYATWSKYNHSNGIKVLYNNKKYFIKIEDLKCLNIHIVF